MNRQQVIELLATRVSVAKATDVVDLLEEHGIVSFKEFGNEGINSVVEQFKASFGTTKTTKYDRFAANRLLKAYGEHDVIAVIKGLASSSEGKYCPTVNNLSQLESKWVSVIKYLRANQVRQLE